MIYQKYIFTGIENFCLYKERYKEKININIREFIYMSKTDKEMDGNLKNYFINKYPCISKNEFHFLTEEQL